MRVPSRLGLAAAVAAVAVSLYLVAQTTRASDEEKFRAAVLKITDAVKKTDQATATKLAQATAKDIEYLEDVMQFLKPRTRGGFGVGEKAGEVFPDGIELKLIAMSRDAPSAIKLNKEAPAIEEMAYRMAAIADITLASAPKADSGAKKKADWIRWTNDMRSESIALAEAAKKKSPAEVKAAAEKLNASCNNCHSVFR